MRKAMKLAPSKADVRVPKISQHLSREVVWRPIVELKPFPDNPRSHPQSQISALMRSIRQGWTNPILIDETATILAGHGRIEAAERLGMTRVPTLTLSGLAPQQKRTIVIADNRLPEQAVWDFDVLRGHFRELIDLDFDVELTGFSTGEIDILLDGQSNPARQNDPQDDASGCVSDEPPVSRMGDIWVLGSHKILCGDSLSRASYERLLVQERAQLVLTDPPYNVRIDGHARGRSRIRHREFAMASGEMTEARFTQFLEDVIRLMIAFSTDGSIHYICMDWRHLYELLCAARPLYSAMKNLLVWNKTNAGMGSFYRSKHELIGVFKNGDAPHINNFGLGERGRYRSNVMDYPGVNALSDRRRQEMDWHPTVKPIALIADLMRDCSRRKGLVLDPFGGSGTAILAAERTERRARVIEIDPIYVDLTVRRWEIITGQSATLEASGQSFADVSATRGVPHGK